MKTQLLCTFTKRNIFNQTIDIIIRCNEIVFDKIYVFQNENEYNQLICTYNVEYDEDFVEGVLFEISHDELLLADKYEVDEYTRKKVIFESGSDGWVYAGT